jgi:elongation factor Ts
MEISMDLIKELREKTGAGIMNCKAALTENKGDLDKAVEYLRKKGQDKASKLTHRAATEGLIHTYVHPGNRIGVIVEVNSETDFVARTDEFQELVHAIALQIAAANPLAVSREDLDPEIIGREKEIYKGLALEEGKPDKVIDKIIEGKLEKFIQESCLLEQEYIKDPDRKINDLVKEFAGRVGENIVVRRFTRYELGRGS